MAPLCPLRPHPLASSPLWSLPLSFLFTSPIPGKLSRLFPFLKNFILSPETTKQHRWPWSGEWMRTRCWFSLCLLKDWEVEGLMGAVKPIPSKAYNKPQALPPVWEAKYHQS